VFFGLVEKIYPYNNNVLSTPYANFTFFREVVKWMSCVSEMFVDWVWKLRVGTQLPSNAIGLVEKYYNVL
jgi:hypothetical protein